MYLLLKSTDLVLRQSTGLRLGAVIKSHLNKGLRGKIISKSVSKRKPK